MSVGLMSGLSALTCSRLAAVKIMKAFFDFLGLTGASGSTSFLGFFLPFLGLATLTVPGDSSGMT